MTLTQLIENAQQFGATGTLTISLSGGNVTGSEFVATASKPAKPAKAKPATKPAKKAAKSKGSPPDSVVAGWSAANAVYASAGYASHGDFFAALTATRKAARVAKLERAGKRGRPTKAQQKAADDYAALQAVYQEAKEAKAATKAA